MPPLRALVAAGHDIALVVTQPDRRRGRGSALVPSPVKSAAAELGLPTSSRVDDVMATGAELGVVVAFGKLIKAHVLDAVPMVNLHFSLLPRWRGAAPVERAILAGDPETGVCLMQLDVGLDTGPVHAREVVPLDPHDSLVGLQAKLVDVGTRMLLDGLSAGLATPVAQEGHATYAAKLDNEELRLDWSRPAVELERVVRLGRAWTTVRGRRLKVLDACGHEPQRAPVAAPTGAGSLGLITVQPEGKAPMDAGAWARGAHWTSGEPLGT